ncbi:hypothetical protein CAPTEDRAFT_190880 [Capitella teleta]|uniref:EGF-like domain-containing protein n=1 Tax=Capitella teleta TaxID=283909 RepID=R7U2T2_CAPTE|nr:hypothetical protein CAPTEDRAFT_190880 [Capitella teleta]|eukprot:ELU00411.1 hypothetical protein CAPTEDRAFT_190880 [Capitella teleta]
MDFRIHSCWLPLLFYVLASSSLMTDAEKKKSFGNCKEKNKDFCLNGGTCSMVENNKPACLCPEGFSGLQCQVQDGENGGKINATLELKGEHIAKMDSEIQLSFNGESVFMVQLYLV